MTGKLLFCGIMFFILGSRNSAAQFLDSSFQSVGYFHNYSSGRFSNITQQPDGKIVAAYSPNAASLFNVARYNPDGSGDTTFGTGGGAHVWCGATPVDMDVAVQPDGKIIAAGYATYCVQIICGLNNLCIARFNTNGVIDSTFGTYGLVKSENVFNPSTIMGALAMRCFLLPSGKIIISGYCYLSVPAYGQYQVFVARLNSNGTKDLTFGSSGVHLFPQNTLNYGDMAVDASGNIFLTGWDASHVISACPDGYLIKLLPNGSPDNSFGIAGKVSFNFSPTVIVPERIQIRQDNKLLISGYLSNSTFLPRTGFISLFNSDGTASSEFTTQLRTFIIPGFNTDITGIKFLPDNHIIYTGNAYNSYELTFVGLLQHDGTDDSTFAGNNSMVRYDTGAFAAANNQAESAFIFQQPDGKIIIGGKMKHLNNNDAYFMLRMMPDMIMTDIPAISNAADLNAISIFPNPVTDQLTIDGAQLKIESIDVSDLFGKKIAHHLLSGKNKTVLDMYALLPGIYFVTIQDEKNNLVTRKIVKM